MFIIPAHKDDSQVTKGRGKGGLATMWDKGLTKYVSQVKTSSFRLQATKFNFPTGSLLLINSYFPCDPRINNFNEEELLVLLREIKSLMRDQHCHFYLVLGDLNAHFSRHSTFTSIVQDFFDELNFEIFWENPDECQEHHIQSVDFTFQNSSNGEAFSSTIDHFVGNIATYNSVTEAGVIHSGENPSNHSPIFMKIRLGQLNLKTEKVQGLRRINWSKSSEESRNLYQTTLANNLDAIAIPDCVTCRDVHCTTHVEQIEEYTMSIMETIEAVAKECLHSAGGGKPNAGAHDIVQGWTQYVKPFCDESKFWHATWYSAGQPRAGPLYDIMSYSKRQYKHAVRRLKRANENIQNDKFVQSLLSGGSNIFLEIKKFRGKCQTYSSRIDDQVGAHNIAGKFADIYSQLYNQHETDDQLDNIEEQIKMKIDGNSLIDIDRITPDVVNIALRQIKAGKSDAMLNVQSDCLTNGPESLIVHLTNLLKTFLVHGRVPYFVLICTLLPLVKDNLSDITTSDNYRAIASGSLLLKLLDMVVMNLEGEKLKCDLLQFGFQSESSTTMCTWTATTVIEHYNQRGTPVYACAMDLSKAFDFVEWVSLFRILVSKAISPVFLRVLLFIYRNQTCNVKWNSAFSYMFKISNGVRQGAVSSPLLFSIYIDGLLVLLRNSGLGCKVANFYYGVLGYADDLLLLSASRTGLQAMVAICEKFMKQRRLKFSTNVNPMKSKTKCIVFSKVKNCQVNLAPITLNGDPLPWVDKVKHLGNLLEQNNSMKLDCVTKRGKMIGKVNSLLQELHFTAPQVKMKLLNFYTTSFYGSNLWNIYSAEVNRIFSTWNVTVRKVFDLPWTTHRYFIEGVSECPHPKTLICSRFVKFLENVSMCNKLSVRFLANMVWNDRRTLAGRTLTKIAAECNHDRASLSSKIARGLVYREPTAENSWRLPFLKELLKARSDSLDIPGFDDMMISDVINDICTT